MDTNMEDKMVRQIEKNLSNNINENLFLTGRVFEKKETKDSENSIRNLQSTTVVRSQDLKLPEDIEKQEKLLNDNYKSSYDYDYSYLTPGMSRAEYIRQAREACLRQLSSAGQYSSRTYDTPITDTEDTPSEQLKRKTTNAMKLFHDDIRRDTTREEPTPQELASFRSLIIRTVCAIVIFLSIFIIDKFNIKIGGFTKEVVQEFVTGNDTLKTLEDIVVSWLK